MTIHEVFQTPDPIVLNAELEHGQLIVSASNVSTTSVDISGPHADDFTVEHLAGGGVRIAEPKWRGWGFGRHTVRVRLPEGSSLVAGCGSASVDIDGAMDEVSLTCGSGAIRCAHARDLAFSTGSGSFEIVEVEGLRAKSGSGAVRVQRLTGEAQITTGSGAIHIDAMRGGLEAKSGSGKLRIGSVSGDVRFASATGSIGMDVIWRGRIDLRTTSGRVRLGIEEGTPVWADVTSTAGKVRSTLPPVGEPVPGQDYVELHVHTVSGAISLDPAPKGLQDDPVPAQPYDGPRGPQRASAYAPIPTEQTVDLTSRAPQDASRDA